MSNVFGVKKGENMKKLFKLGIIGCGNMANAIISGAKDILKNENIVVFDSDIEKAKSFSQRFGAVVGFDNNFVAINSEYVLIAVKPQSFSEIATELSGANYLISIMAGIKTDTILSKVPTLRGMVRIMPNAPAMVNKGMSALSFVNSSEIDKEFVISIFNSIGKTVIIEEEKLDAVTAISGSGPAYVYYFIKSMIDAGQSIGLTEDESKVLTFQTFLGATEFAEKSSLSLSELIDMVCSKGGTTIEAINSFKNEETDKIIDRAVKKCFVRSKELSGGK